jgi:type I restriction enzyme R subunit
MTSHFTFLAAEWPALHEAAVKAEQMAHPDPRAACFYARRALEMAVSWLYKHDSALTLPYQENLSALIHAPGFRQAVGDAVFYKTNAIKDLGNLAVHSSKPVRPYDALMAVKELFHVCFWLARHYSRGAKPMDGVFNPELLPKSAPLPPQTLDQLQKLETQLREKDENLKTLLSDKTELDAELVKLRAEIAEAKKANAAQPDTHDYSEAETRDYYIDLLLKEAGWPLDQEREREFQVTGMPNVPGTGFVDYVQWGDDGKPLGILEAKRTRKSPKIGQQQAKLYADCLEKMFGQRPVIFLSNGYEHWIWDDVNYPPREVQGFYKKDELELLIQRRSTRKKLAEAPINKVTVERYYHERAIRRVGETFEVDHQRKSLLVMATGSGKTRLVIALSELLMQCNWAKRVLFLADRVALVNQAVNAFKKFLPDAAPVNLVTEKNAQGRVYVSTYPTMMRLIDETKDGQRRFGPGHFDLVIIDEAHRSVYQKYGAIFRYFDSLLVGLTATPREEIDRDTYSLFELETGVPTDAYTLDQAVSDGFLVPPRSVSVPLRIQRSGLRYDELTEEEKAQWDELEWNEEGDIPDRVEAEAINKWLFNQPTVDMVLEHLMKHGQKVAGGDRLGKTIIFAKNQDHAEYIAERFDANYPHLKGSFARVIHCDLPYAQTLIDDFSISAKAPHIAISVDMLDTGIDVPEVVNLVFFKMVRSKTKFWQMIGRGTRLCPNLFGPDLHKQFFFVFDYCQNLEFFRLNPPETGGAGNDSLSKRLFARRLELVGCLDALPAPENEVQEQSDPLKTLRQDIVVLLQTEVAAMNEENFLVRPQRRLIEVFRKPEAWQTLDGNALHELSHNVAGLPTELPAEDEEAKRFDLLLLNLQLTRLRAEPGFARLQQQLKDIAGLLEEKQAIPMVKEVMPLIQDLQTDEWWQDVTLPMLEQVRKKLRTLIKLIDKQARKPVFTNFEDEMGAPAEIELPGFTSVDNFERFRAKARHFLKTHEDHIAIHKLRSNEALTKTDLAELERILIESGIGTPDDVAKAKTESAGLGLFVRSLIGLNREAAKLALAGFAENKTLSANQFEFVNLIVDHLTEHGVMTHDLLYESPYIDFNPQGVDGVFAPIQVERLMAILEEVRERAVA